MLDKSRSHGIVYGLPGVAFEQDGKQYGPQGAEVEESAQAVDTEDPTPKKRGRPFKNKDE